MFEGNGAELVIRLLERQGVKRIPGIPGGANLPLYDALGASRSIRHILARHEQGAGFMAQGMARTTGQPAVFFATSGPGATNTLTAIADAKLDSVPIICITGQVPSQLIGTDAFQEVDIYGMSLPVTKHNFLVRSVAELAHVIPEAFRIASPGRPGPVLIDIPKDVQTARIRLSELPEPAQPDPVEAPDVLALSQAAQMICAAKRPILLLGGGVASSGASSVARKLAEAASLPVTMSLLGLGALPDAHPLNLGMLGMHGTRAANILLEECDLLLVAGARLDDRATGRLERFCSEAKLIHIDIDQSELDKLKLAHLAITADVGAALAGLLPLVQAEAGQIGGQCEGRGPWLARVAQCKAENPSQFPGLDNPLTPYGLVRCTGELLASSEFSSEGEGAIVVTDVGQHQMRAAQAYPDLKPRAWLTSGGLGTMGFGLPAAIGAALANPARRVVCFSGDGSLQMNIQELATAAETGANVTVVLADNGGLGLVQQQQDLFYGRRIFASDYRVRIDFVKIAEGFGVRALDLNLSRAPLSDLERALKREGPCLVRVPVAAEDNVYPIVPPGAANIDMIGGEPARDMIGGEVCAAKGGN
ncbi:MAG: acetolactate synthase, large subunit, biosynthetic type [Desulfovibrionales bacterium GWA2_65_9]|nr:MAG: acetolactate synthase, large subunit, biosynthetic type [Desulfovibrionales bacterium GWA2_65_9]